MDAPIMTESSAQTAEVDLITPDGFEQVFPNYLIQDERAENKGITLCSNLDAPIKKSIRMAHETAKMNQGVSFFICAESLTPVPVFAADPDDQVYDLVLERIVSEDNYKRSSLAQQDESASKNQTPGTSLTDTSAELQRGLKDIEYARRWGAP